MKTTTFFEATSVRTNPGTYGDLLNTSFSDYSSHMRGTRSNVPHQVEAKLLKPGKQHALLNAGTRWTTMIFLYPLKGKTSINTITVTIGFIGLFFALLGLIMLGGPHGMTQRDIHYRIPPVCNPETVNSHRFQTFVSDVGLGRVLADLGPHQQAAALAARLQGGAREIANAFTPQELTIVVVVVPNGVHFDPLSNLLGLLVGRYAPLEDEARFQTWTDMWNFTKRHGETINSLIPRYETTASS